MPPCVGRFHRPNSSRCFLDIQRLPALGPCLTWSKACRGTTSPPSSTWWPISCGSGRSSMSRAWQTDWTSYPTSSVTFCCDPPGNKSCKLPMAASVWCLLDDWGGGGGCMCYIPLRESVSGMQKIRHRKSVSHMIRLMDNQCFMYLNNWRIFNP